MINNMNMVQGVINMMLLQCFKVTNVAHDTWDYNYNDCYWIMNIN